MCAESSAIDADDSRRSLSVAPIVRYVYILHKLHGKDTADEEDGENHTE